MNLNDLKHRLAALAQHDGRLAIFGATMHGWRSTPVSAEAVEAYERRHGLRLPEAYRQWITQVGVGAGPFYGLEGLDAEDLRPGRPFPHEGPYEGAALPAGVDAIDGTALLSSQGCGYYDRLVLRGSHAGEVWVDLREGEGPLALWYPSFEAWIEAWLLRSEAEWAVEYLAEEGADAEAGFAEVSRAAVARVLAGVDDPMQAQYPLPVDKLWQASARFCLAAGDLVGAEAAFESAALASREPEGVRAVGQCALARVRGDDAGRLAAAAAGLASNVWWATKKRLLIEQIDALECLERWDEAFAARIALAQHDRGNLHARYDVAWIYLLRNQAAEAAAWLREAAVAGVGCNREDSLEVRVAQVAAGLTEALRGSGHPELAAALEAALV